MDDRLIREFRDLIDVQAAIRDHTPGEDLRLRVQRAGEEPAEVRVSRAAPRPSNSVSCNS